MKQKEKTQSIRVNQDIAKKSKIFAIKKGGSIKTIMEYGALWVMSQGIDQYSEHLQNKKSKN